MSLAPTCSIIIRTLNEGRYLGILLKTLRGQSYPQSCFEVIVVDSGSTDDTLAIAKQYDCRVVTLERSQFSFGRSLNIGCRAARGSIYVFISGHCVPVERDWLWKLVSPLHDPSICITYGRQEGGVETKFSEHALFQKYFPEHDISEQSPFFCNNANLAMKATDWKIKPFDELLTGLEDMHMAKRLVENGQVVRYVPDASVFHYHHERWSQVRRRYEREALALREIMPEVQLQWHDAVRYFLAALLSDGGKALAKGLFWRKIREILFFRFCQYFGAWKGHHLHRELSRRQKEKYFYPN